MSLRITIAALLIGLLLPAQVLATETGDLGDPIVKLKGSYELELDLSVMVADLLPRVVTVLTDEDSEEAETLRRLLDEVGFDALRTVTFEGEQSKDRETAEFRLKLAKDGLDAPLARLLTTPNGRCEFGRYVNRDDLALGITIHNLPGYLTVLLDFLNTPTLREILGDMPVNADGDLDLDGFVPRRDLLPLLAGELDVFILADAGTDLDNPISMPFVLAYRSTDGFALRDRLVQIIDGSDSPDEGDLGSALASVEPETVGDFEFKELPFGGAVATREDFLVFGLAGDALRTLLATDGGDLDVPDGIEWVYMNGPRYGALLQSMMDMANMYAPPEAGSTEWMLQIYDVLFDHVYEEEALYRSRKDGLEGTITVTGPVLTGLYRMLPTLLDRLPEILADFEDDDEYVYDYFDTPLADIEMAMAAYAVDHDMVFPEDPAQLVLEEYLETWPLGLEVPPGEYEDGAYSYHTYRDESGAVVGYILVLYGEGDCFDFYTPENIGTEPFQPDEDGIPDGVVDFCYDGAAIDYVDTYLGL